MAACKMFTSCTKRHLTAITRGCTHYHVRQKSIKAMNKTVQSTLPTTILGVCYSSEAEILPYHRVRQLHTGIPQRIQALPYLTNEILEANDLEDNMKIHDIIPVAMHFEQKGVEDEILSSIPRGSLTSDVGQSYADFKSSVFMTYHDSSVFFDPDS